MVIPAQISSLTGALIVLIIELKLSLVMISYTLTISAGIGGLTWATYVVLLCRELMGGWGVTLFFFLIVLLTTITVTQHVLYIHTLKQGNFPFAACS